MCHSHASVFFGLFARTVDLVHAGMAWEELKPTFLAVDIIASRRTSGTLSVEGAARIQDVPQEVWAMIKDELCALGVKKAAQTLSEVLQCGLCLENGVNAPCDFRTNECDACHEVSCNNGGVNELFYGHSEQIGALLRAFHLYQPSSRLLVANEPYYVDREACSAIAFPPPSRTLLPSASPESTDDTHGHEIQPFAPSILSLHPNAANKVLYFCRLFRLEIVDDPSPSQAVLYAAAQRAFTGTTTVQTVEPRWQLWATSECSP